MARNLVLGFALALGGAVLLDAGIKQFEQAANPSSPNSSTGGGSSSPGTTPGLGVTGAGTAGLTGLNPDQQTFANQLSADTGLDPNVVAAWVLSEEPGSSIAAPNGANNWLNIGSTDSGFYGANTAAWQDPVSAANATAQWLAGADNIAGYGTASAGIRSILATARQSPAAQVKAIQSSGWASTGYPNLLSVYQQIASETAAAIKKQNAATPKHKPGFGVLAPSRPVTIDGIKVTG